MDRDFWLSYVSFCHLFVRLDIEVFIFVNASSSLVGVRVVRLLCKKEISET